MFPVTRSAAVRNVCNVQKFLNIPSLLRHQTFLHNKAFRSELQSQKRLIHNFLNEQRRFQSSKQGNQDKSEKTPISWRISVIFAIVGGLYAIHLYNTMKNQELREAKRKRKKLGTAAIGGTYELIDFDGKTRTDKDFLGKWVLMYFGFTHCPDICPDEIEKLVKVVDTIDADKELPNIQPVFITVDPDRDTPKAMKQYCEEFSPKIIGLTGSKEKIDEACKNFRVYYSKGPEDEDGDYIVDHTIIAYLLNPKGEFVEYFGKNKTYQMLVDEIKEYMEKYALFED
ncbi:protein SCO1 homolog, mitochondrial-like [Saccostrea echinata]|uniref:protein SCO1 homolog, mitochondrial-like n=1 Tax=Saccostrea echinata TaxID=191078 RepID=UPI002A8186F6|nr:protein SCO1 homolog, mitochondrial-like [Saccostrea echinata]